MTWLKKVGVFMGKVLKVVAKDAAPVSHQAAAVAEIMFPQFAPAIAVADGIVTSIAREAVQAEALASVATATPGDGVQKLAAVLSASGPVIDSWIAASFPGSGQVSTVSKAGLINAVVAILNEVEPTSAIPI